MRLSCVSTFLNFLELSGLAQMAQKQGLELLQPRSRLRSPAGSTTGNEAMDDDAEPAGFRAAQFCEMASEM